MGGTKFGGSPGRCPVFPSPTFYLALVKRTEEQMRGGGAGDVTLTLGRTPGSQEACEVKRPLG